MTCSYSNAVYATVLDVPINPPRWDVLHLTFNRILLYTTITKEKEDLFRNMLTKIPKSLPGLFDNVAEVDCPGLHAQ